jgi:AcrR family transcriptional regulator
LYHIKNDLRAMRSAETIYEALVKLMGKQRFVDIRVTDLVEQAQIGRATFYRSFDAQEDVLRWRCDQMLGELIPYMAVFARSQPGTGGNSLLKPLLRFFYLDSTIIELLIEAERIDILQVAVEERFEGLRPKAEALLEVPEDYLSYWLALRAAAAVSVLVQWVKGGKRQAPDDLADGIAELAAKTSRLNLLV